MASVRKHIRHLRTARGLTQEQLAENLFVTRQTVSAWETGKAQPDLETLERIASALDTEVTEVIYGVSRPQALGPLKCRWAMIGGIITIIIVFILIILFKNGTYGTWKHGLRYQFWNQNYRVSIETLPGDYSVELDLRDLPSNVGRVLYEDASGCRVTVDSVEQDGEDYRVIFQAEGVCSPAGGLLVSGCYNQRRDKHAYGVELSASMSTSVGGETYGPCHYYVTSSMSETNTNLFGFYVFPLELFLSGELALSEKLDRQDGVVTVTVSGLTRLNTSRLPYTRFF